MTMTYKLSINDIKYGSKGKMGIVHPSLYYGEMLNDQIKFQTLKNDMLSSNVENCICLQPNCKALHPIGDGDEREPQEKSQGASEFGDH